MKRALLALALVPVVVFAQHRPRSTSAGGSSSSLGPSATGTSLTLTPGSLQVGQQGISTDGGVVLRSTLDVTGAVSGGSFAGPSGAGGVVTIAGGVQVSSNKAIYLNGATQTKYIWYASATDEIQVDGVPFTATNAKTKGSKTLLASSGTVTVTTGVKCVCSNETTGTAVKCPVSGTTLTISPGSSGADAGADVISYICL